MSSAAELLEAKRDERLTRDAHEWEPAPPPPAPIPQPAAITADELAARMEAYVERILTDPSWHAEQARKREEKAERRKAREERIAKRRKKK